MTPETVAHELHHFAEEYRSYCRAVAIPDAIDSSNAQFTVTTLEDVLHKCQLSDAGWELTDDATYYATSQALMSAISPMFRDKWANRLLDELEVYASRH